MSCIARRATKQTQPSICIAAPSASAPCSAPCVGGAFHSKRLQIRSCDDSAHTMIWDCVALYFWSEFKETETLPVQHPASPAPFTAKDFRFAAVTTQPIQWCETVLLYTSDQNSKKQKPCLSSTLRRLRLFFRTSNVGLQVAIKPWHSPELVRRVQKPVLHGKIINNENSYKQEAQCLSKWSCSFWMCLWDLTSKHLRCGITYQGIVFVLLVLVQIHGSLN